MKRLCILFSTAFLTLPGCGKKIEKTVTEKIIEHSSNGKVKFSKDGSSMKFKDDKGSMTFASDKSLKIPEGFPSDIFIIRHSKVAMAVENPKGYAISLETDNDAASVETAYKEEMAQRGWTNKNSYAMQKQTALIFEKDTRAANVLITTGNKKTVVAIMVALKK